MDVHSRRAKRALTLPKEFHFALVVAVPEDVQFTTHETPGQMFFLRMEMKGYEARRAR
jgi:hypothetical protein